jgi:uncharacterized protein YndB with AHSA1/START domain
MPITSLTSDPVALTLTAVGDYPVPVERLWEAWTDPRQLERFWGPPEWPATFIEHDPRVGGRSRYFMCGPDGTMARGYWRFLSVEPGRGFEVMDGFADEAGEPNPAMPEVHMQLRLEPTAEGSRFVIRSTFASVEAMEQVVAMGMTEGLRAALGQLDPLLADLPAWSATVPTALEVVDDTHVRVVREVRGTLPQVWRCFHEAALVQRWMLGPPGWTMPVCQVAAEVGSSYRYEWVSDDGAQRFGFEGELLEQEAPRRAVTTERMLGTDGPSTVNALVLRPRPGGRTQIELSITYPSAALRDMILGTGMVDGMEASYARMEAEVLAAAP